MDILKDNIDKALEKIKAINKPKSLLEDGKLKREFEANGKKYLICPPEHVFNIARQTYYSNIELAFAANQTPTEIKIKYGQTYDNIVRMFGATDKEMLDLKKRLIEDCFNNYNSFKGELTARYGQAFLICTLFIIREGEDLSTWSFDLAHEKIDDWVKENLKASDFFSLALALSKECQRILEQE